MKGPTVATHPASDKAPAMSLQDIRIASPCPADWGKMVGDERVRHCAECNLNVYNLSAMTERQVRQLIAGNQGQRVCLRLYRRADGTILTQDCPWGLRALKRRVTRMASAILFAVISVSAAAKTKPQQNSQPATEKQQRESGLEVIVVDAQGAVVSGAQIMLSRAKGKTGCVLVAKGSTDSGGRVQLDALPEGEYTLTVEAKYFIAATRTITLKSRQVLRLNVPLIVDPKGSTTVEVGGLDIVPLVDTDKQVTNSFQGTRLQSAPAPIGVIVTPPHPLRP